MELPNGTKNASTDSLLKNCLFANSFSKTETIIQVSAFSVILVLSLVGNVLITFLVLRKKLRKNNDLFLMNMAISDMVVPLMILPREIIVNYTKKDTWPFGGVWGDVTCKIYVFLENVSPCVSILTLICMTIDRFCAIVFPIKINLISDKTRNVMIVSTWVIGSATSSTFFFTMTVKKDIQGNNFCSHSWPSGSLTDSKNIYMTFSLLFYFIIPLVLLIILYSIILMKLKTKKQVHSSHMARKRMQTAKRVTIMTVCVVGIFALFWGPYYTVMTLVAFYWKWNYPPICSWPTIILTVRFLTFAHAAVNPFVCFIFVEKYRRKITAALEKARNLTSSVLEMSRLMWGSSRSFTLQDTAETAPSERTATLQASRSTGNSTL